MQLQYKLKKTKSRKIGTNDKDNMYFWLQQCVEDEQKEDEGAGGGE